MIPVSHPRYKREFADEVIKNSHNDNFSRSIVAVYPQGLGKLFYFYHL